MKEASEDEEYLTEMEWRERVFAKLLDPLSDRFKSNAYDDGQTISLTLLSGISSYLCSRQGSGALQRAGRRRTRTSPTKFLHNGAHCLLICLVADTECRRNGKLHADFMAWVNSCGVVVGGLILACLVVEMKNAKQYDKDLCVSLFVITLSYSYPLE